MRLEWSDLLLCKFSKDGQGPKTYNCWNLCREIYKRAGRSLPLYSNWICDVSIRCQLIETLKEGSDFIKLEKPE